MAAVPSDRRRRRAARIAAARLAKDRPDLPPGGPGREPHPLRTTRLAVAALFFMNGVLFANWVSRIPAVQAERGFSHGALGMALLALGLGALVAMPLAGWSSARFGSDRVCRWTALGYCAALPVLAFVPGPAMFVLGLFCFGAVHGALDVAMNLQAVEIERRYDRPIMSSFHALFSFGGLAGALMGGWVAALGISPRPHFLAVAAILAGSVALFIFPRLFRRAETGEPDRSGEAESKAAFAGPSRTLVVLGTIAFCVMMGEGAMADWSAIFLRQVTGANESIAAVGYAAFSVAMAIGRLSGDRLSQRFGPVILVRCGGLLAAGGLALVLLTGQPLLALAGFAIVGAGFATVVPQVFSAAGPAVAAVTTIGYLGFLIGPPLIGLAAELLGLSGALGLVVAASLLLVALAGGVERRNGPRFSPVPRPHTSGKALANSALQELT